MRLIFTRVPNQRLCRYDVIIIFVCFWFACGNRNVGCADIMRSVNSTNPIFPTLRLPWSTVTRRPGRVIQAYRCCNNDLCNEDAQISTVARTLGSPRALFNGTAAPADQLMANGTVTPAEQRMTNGTVAPAEQRMTNGTIAPVEQRMTNGTVAPVEQQMANGTQTAAAASESSPSKQWVDRTTASRRQVDDPSTRNLGSKSQTPKRYMRVLFKSGRRLKRATRHFIPSCIVRIHVLSAHIIKKNYKIQKLVVKFFPHVINGK